MKFLVRIRNLLQFQLEQFILRGAFSRLMVIALAMILIASGAGLLVYGATPAKTYADLPAAVWWAFLRLTDSGYLGDDTGPVLRTVSTILTVLGVVLFVGALIATMTQWLNDTIETLEAGYTPIAQNNHIVILGWTNRTVDMIEQLVLSEGRVSRFLRSHGGGSLRVAVLANRVSPALAQEIKDRLGRRYRPRRITLRSGSALRVEHLNRVDYLHAAVVILPAYEFESDSAPDERTIKTLMSAAHSAEDVAPEDLPLMVAEIFDADLLETARRAYPGPAEIIGTPQIISRLLAQNARHRGLSYVYNALLDGVGDQIFVRPVDALVGERLVDVVNRFEDAVLLGLARHGDLHPLYMDREERIEAGDSLAFVSDRYESCEAVAASTSQVPPLAPAQRPDVARVQRRILVLGWNQKLPSLLAEFEAHRHEDAEIDVFSILSREERELTLRRKGTALTHTQVRHFEIDITSHAEMTAQDIAGYDKVIIVASDWLGSAEAADARLLLGYLVLQRVLAGAVKRPDIIVETMSADNASLFSGPGVECLVSPDMQSNLLTQIALRRELHWVLDDVFGAGGSEIAFRSLDTIDIEDRTASFNALSRERAAYGEILLGIMRIGGERPVPELNPDHKNAPMQLADGDELIVLAMV